MSHIFLSYARKDGSELAEHLYKRLIGCGYDVFKDDHDLPLGASFPRAISDALEGAGDFILLMTRAALNSAWVDDEVNMALTARRRVISIVPDDVDNNEIPLQLRKLNYLSMKGATDWQALSRLVDDLDGGKSIPRVYNMSGHKDIEVTGILVLNHSDFGLGDLNDPLAMNTTAQHMAQEALPYIKAGAGIVPHGHPALACCILAFLLGAVNRMPKVYYTFMSKEQFCISAEKCVTLQDIRDAGFVFRSHV